MKQRVTAIIIAAFALAGVAAPVALAAAAPAVPVASGQTWVHA